LGEETKRVEKLEKVKPVGNGKKIEIVRGKDDQSS